MIVQVVNSGVLVRGVLIFIAGGWGGDFNACESQYGAPSAGWYVHF